MHLVYCCGDCKFSRTEGGHPSRLGNAFGLRGCGQCYAYSNRVRDTRYWRRNGHEIHEFSTYSLVTKSPSGRQIQSCTGSRTVTIHISVDTGLERHSACLTGLGILEMRVDYELNRQLMKVWTRSGNQKVLELSQCRGALSMMPRGL